MSTIQARTKYYLLSVLGALVVAGGVLAFSPPSQAEEEAPITVDKECTPNPVQAGQQITCTIDVVPDPVLFPTPVIARDTLPDSVTLTGATQEQFLNGSLSSTEECTVSGNTVTCDNEVEGGIIRDQEKTLQVTIEAIAEQCGTFTNTADVTDILVNNTFTSTAEFTVEGCEGPGGGGGTGGGGSTGGAGGGGGTSGGATPITQESVQESEAGELDQTFDIS